MTTTTVEVEKTVTEEEELDICDDCGREVDEAGGEFNPPNALDRGTHLHFCSDCLDRFSDEDINPEGVQRVKDWLDKPTFQGGNVKEFFQWGKVLSLITYVGCIITGLFYIFIGADPIVLLPLCVLLITSYFAADQIETGVKTIEDL